MKLFDTTDASASVDVMGVIGAWYIYEALPVRARARFLTDPATAGFAGASTTMAGPRAHKGYAHKG